MLLAVCQEHASPAVRRRTAGLLFNLIKRPNAAQRVLIVGACVQLALRVGPARTALELLPHVLSQVRWASMAAAVPAVRWAMALAKCLLS